MVAGPNRKMQRVLQLSMVLTLAYVGATFYFGIRAHSLALISEAGHNVSDFLALALSFVAVHFQTRPATPEKTFGYQRAGVLAAFVNALTLVVLAIWIAVAAIHRLSASREPDVALCSAPENTIEPVKKLSQRPVALLPWPEQQRAKRRAEREGVESRQDHRDCDGQGKLLVKPSGDAWNKDCWHEDCRQDQGDTDDRA